MNVHYSLIELIWFINTQIPLYNVLVSEIPTKGEHHLI